MKNEYKVLKKFGEFKKGSVFVPENETQEELDEAVEDGFLALVPSTSDDVGDTAENTGETKGKNTKTKVTKVTFVIRNPDTKDKTSTRVFSAVDHGVDFLTVANEFAATNSNVVLSRKDE